MKSSGSGFLLPAMMASAGQLCLYERPKAMILRPNEVKCSMGTAVNIVWRPRRERGRKFSPLPRRLSSNKNLNFFAHAAEWKEASDTRGEIRAVERIKETVCVVPRGPGREYCCCSDLYISYHDYTHAAETIDRWNEERCTCRYGRTSGAR